MVILILLAVWFLAFIVNVTVMIFGWGVEPQNWLVIVGGFVFTVLIMSLSEFVKRFAK